MVLKRIQLLSVLLSSILFANTINEGKIVRVEINNKDREFNKLIYFAELLSTNDLQHFKQSIKTLDKEDKKELYEGLKLFNKNNYIINYETDIALELKNLKTWTGSVEEDNERPYTHASSFIKAITPLTIGLALKMKSKKGDSLLCRSIFSKKPDTRIKKFFYNRIKNVSFMNSFSNVLIFSSIGYMFGNSLYYEISDLYSNYSKSHPLTTQIAILGGAVTLVPVILSSAGGLIAGYFFRMTHLKTVYFFGGFFGGNYLEKKVNSNIDEVIKKQEPSIIKKQKLKILKSEI
jgi:hypothetical protein